MKTTTVTQPNAPRLLTQPGVGIITGTVALAAVAESWIVRAPHLGSGTQTFHMAALAAGLVLALALSYRFPIHIRYTIKMQMGNVPLYLMAILLPPQIAPLVAGAGLVAGELSVRRVRGTYPSDIATQVGRLTVVTLAASLVAHLGPGGSLAHVLLLIVAALILLSGDLLTAVLAVVPVTGERPWALVLLFARGLGPGEAGQYFMGLMGAIVAMQDIWGTILLVLPVALLYRTCKRAKEMNETTYGVLVRMAKTVDLRDPYTGGHSDRVYRLTERVLRQMRVSGPEAHLITTAARVHDIGKIRIPDVLLHKHERLTEEEWAIMERHPGDGADLVARYPDFAAGADVVRHHHERWDGTGYPDRLAGSAIPFGSRIIAVADSFDAMTTDRPYRKGMTATQAAATLRGGRGTQWDARIVDAFLEVIKDQLEAEAHTEVRGEAGLSGALVTV